MKSSSMIDEKQELCFNKERSDRFPNLLNKLKLQGKELKVAIQAKKEFLIIVALEKAYTKIAKKINSVFAKLGLDNRVEEDYKTEFERSRLNFAYRNPNQSSHIIKVASTRSWGHTL